MAASISIPVASFTYAAHLLDVVVAILVRNIQFRDVLALSSANKNLIFNLHPALMLIGFIILGSEAIMSYKVLPSRKEVKKVVHLGLHKIMLVLGAVGIYIAFKFYNESGPNLN